MNKFVVDGFEICFYNSNHEPVSRMTCSGTTETQYQIGRVLRSRDNGIYTASSWPVGGKGPDGFACHYINDRGEIFNSTSPIILSPAQAAKLRRRPGI